MGTWGADTFENDTACDWAYSLEDVDDLALVEAALTAVLDEEEYLDADLGCEALAACEVVARLRGNFGTRNASTGSVDEWVNTHPQEPPPALVQLAHRAIDRVTQADSELRQLWDSAGAEPWLAAVESLRRRLG